MKFGLSSFIIQEIQSILAQNPKIRRAIVFGSRAKDNFRPGSDIDLALFGDDLNFNDLLDLYGKWEAADLLYKIDFVDAKTIKEPALIDHINRVGQLFYERANQVETIS